MKKILLLFFVSALLAVTVGAQTPTDDTFTVSDLIYDEDITWYEGDDEKEGAYYFIVSISGERLYCACNLSITLPNGLSFIYDDDEGEYLIRKNNDSEKLLRNSHAVGSGKPGVAMNIAVSSNTNQEFRGTSGKLFNVYVNIDEGAFSSCSSPKPIVKLSGLNLTTSAAVKYVPADFSCRPFTTGIPTERTIPVNVSAANKIGTLIVPFDTELPSGLKAYSCNAVVDDLLTLTPVASLESCTPYIIYAENGYSGNLSGTAELSDDSNVTDIFTDGYLTGVLTGTTVNTGYILQNKGTGPMFYDAEGGNFSLPAGRCYLTPPASPVKAFLIDFDDTTGIKDNVVNGKSVNGKLFDLSGRSVSSPTRGIYIEGTRKVVIR